MLISSSQYVILLLSWFISGISLVSRAQAESQDLTAVQAPEASNVAELTDLVEASEGTKPVPPELAYPYLRVTRSAFQRIREREELTCARLLSVGAELREARLTNREAASVTVPLIALFTGLGVSVVGAVPMLLAGASEILPHSSGSIDRDLVRLFIGTQVAGGVLALTGFGLLRMQQSRQPERARVKALVHEHRVLKEKLRAIRRERSHLERVYPFAALERQGASFGLSFAFDG